MTEAERYLDQRLNNKNSDMSGERMRRPMDVEIPWYKMYWRVWKNFAVFSGRARRREYWIFFGVNFLVSLALGIFDEWVGMDVSSILHLSFCVICVIPSLAVGVRRLHDTGRSGAWFLLGLVPLTGLVLFFFFCKAGMTGPNKYGDDPKETGRFA